LLLQFHPRESVASVVQTLKGGSSYVLRREFGDLEEFVWSNAHECAWDESFWSVGYFAESIGQREEKAVRRYIINQREI
jgi:putative transposase